jgi:hypothetical protein
MTNSGTTGKDLSGAMIIIRDRIYFIPREDLHSFRVPDAAIRAIRAKVDEQIKQGKGTSEAIVLGAEFDMSGRILQFSSIMEHALTASRVC